MSLGRALAGIGAIAGALLLAACAASGAPTSVAASPAAAATAPAPARDAVAPGPASRHSGNAALPHFTPPPASALPAGKFGDMVRLGRNIFTDTPRYARPYVGDALNCESCHLDAGRRPDSAPMWAAYVRYPRYRAKNGKVNSFAERLQGCFRFSMNGKAPPADGEVIQALTAYSYWLATGAPTGENLAGYGYPKQGFTSPEPPSYARGSKVYASHCALCHGSDGQGQKAGATYVFPPVWGPRSFNWGAGMASVNNAAAFVEANMPFSRGGTLDAQDAWDVAYFLDAHERPQDPRYQGSVAATRKAHHDSKWSLYGTVVNGHLLGSGDASRHR